MKIVVIGGTGRIGSKVISGLHEHGHDVVAAAPSTGVNAFTGEGLADVLAGARVVVDVTNSPSFEESAAREFFTVSTSNLLREGTRAAVLHHVALSVVGTERLARESGYFKAKLEQETLIAESGMPYTIVRATQFFEFLDAIADSATVDGAVRLPHKWIQPMAGTDVAEAVAIAAVSEPVNGIAEVGGPERFPLPELIRTALTAHGDTRDVITDPYAGYWGVDIDEDTLVPGNGATLFDTRFSDWVLETAAKS